MIFQITFICLFVVFFFNDLKSLMNFEYMILGSGIMDRIGLRRLLNCNSYRRQSPVSNKMWWIFGLPDLTDNKNLVSFCEHYLLICQCINETTSLLTFGNVAMPNLHSSYYKGTRSLVLLSWLLLSHRKYKHFCFVFYKFRCFLGKLVAYSPTLFSIKNILEAQRN